MFPAFYFALALDVLVLSPISRSPVDLLKRAAGSWDCQWLPAVDVALRMSRWNLLPSPCLWPFLFHLYLKGWTAHRDENGRRFLRHEELAVLFWTCCNLAKEMHRRHLQSPWKPGSMADSWCLGERLDVMDTSPSASLKSQKLKLPSRCFRAFFGRFTWHCRLKA